LSKTNKTCPYKAWPGHLAHNYELHSRVES